MFFYDLFALKTGLFFKTKNNFIWNKIFLLPFEIKSFCYYDRSRRAPLAGAADAQRPSSLLFPDYQTFHKSNAVCFDVSLVCTWHNLTWGSVMSIFRQRAKSKTLAKFHQNNFWLFLYVCLILRRESINFLNIDF